MSAVWEQVNVLCVCVCVYICVSLLVPISRFSHFFNVTLGGPEDEAVLVCVCVS